MRFTIILFLLAAALASTAQNSDSGKNYLDLPWRVVATRMSETWYATDDAKKVAENVLFCQQEIGGWAKNKPYHHPLTDAAKAEIQKNKSGVGATIDNGATITEMKFLAKMYQATKDNRYYTAFEKGFNYLLAAQYNNGGWPQYFPYRKGSVAYASHITYNDDAMVNVLLLLKDIAEQKPNLAALPITDAMRSAAKQAFSKGIDCILKTQIKVNGVPTVWCAQHDEETLLPAKARAYELPSFSGQESEGIVSLLMQIDNPSEAIISSIKHAMAWFNAHKITGIRVENRPGADKKRNIVVVEDLQAPALLARFYDLETAKPFFCDRDGIKKSSINDLGAERRNGYSWYNDEYTTLLKAYSKWLKKWNMQD